MIRPTIGVAAALAACMVACEDRPSARSEPSTDPDSAVVDPTGRVFPTDRPPGRVVSLVPSATQVIAALGEGGRLVGRTDFDTAAALAGLPSVGGGLDPSVEVLVSLRPDLVIRFHGEADQRTPTQLDELGIAHLAVHPERIEDVRAMVRDLGRLLGRVGRADSLVTSMDAGIADVRRRVANLPLRSVAFLLDGTPTWAAGPDTFVGELIVIGGGTNAFHDLDRPWVPMSAEELIARDIEVVLTPEGSTPGGVPPGVPIVEVSGLTQLPGPRLAQAASEIARAIHPSAVP